MKLLVAALASELQAFPAELPGFDRLVTGPGKLKAAFGLTRALDGARYDEIVVVGTAGSVDDDLGSGVYEVGAAIQHDVQDLDGVIGRHVSLPERVETGRDGLTVATGDIFVDDAGAVARIRSLGGVLVDMETFAYLWVAEQFDVPIRVLRAVSDRAQDGATQVWDEVVAACSAQLWERLQREYDLRSVL
ncbi:MAG: nucleoside phosphorylase [Microbacterium sp.]